MIITTHVTHRGKEKPVSELSASSMHRVDVQCPECKQVRNVFYRSIAKAGHCVCQSCMMKRQAKAKPVGKRYGRLVVVGPSEKSGLSICKCDCGKITEVANRNLENGITKSCGCLKLENFDNANRPKGENHGMWKGGISGERPCLMSQKTYKDWRLSVYEKDNYTCQKCKQVGGELNAHHIENYADNKEKACLAANGATLCIICHASFHKIYGRKNNTQEQLDEFLRKYSLPGHVYY